MSAANVIDTPHTDAIHDIQADYYGVLVATGSSDRTVCIREFNADGTAGAVVDTLQGHDGAVWMVAWGHPRFGTLLASASYDGKVIVWSRKTSNARFEAAYIGTAHTGSVNAVVWAPHELGLRLASASSDGTVREVQCENGAWGESTVIGTHSMGALSVAWCPTVSNGTTLVCTGGCDARVKLWANKAEEGRVWTMLSQFECKDWVRDVAFEPTLGQQLAVVAQDKQLRVFGKVSAEDGELSVDKLTTTPLEEVPWRVSWSPQGAVAAVTTADGKVTLYRESQDPSKSVWSAVNTVTL
eukprot:PhM_4_TR16500/c0_g1_i1/m.18398/K14004/SEC13; protein transport protein SEC13